MPSRTTLWNFSLCWCSHPSQCRSLSEPLSLCCHSGARFLVNIFLSSSLTNQALELPSILLVLECSPIPLPSSWGWVPRTSCTNTSGDPPGVYSGLISILDKMKQAALLLTLPAALLSPARVERKARHHRDYMEAFLQMLPYFCHFC